MKVVCLKIFPIALGFFTFLSAFPANAQASNSFGFFNRCSSRDIRVAVSWKDAASDEWRNDAWWTFSPGERSLLSEPRTNNRIFYYYAETTDGSLRWESRDQPSFVIGGRRYTPRRVTANFSDRSYYVELTCPGETPLLAPETSSEVVSQRYENMGGGWGGARATLYRSGLLVIEGRAVSNSMRAATRTTVNVVGVDRNGNALFVSRHLDIPTACSTLDSCSSDRRGRSDQSIPPDIARYVSRLNIHVSDRQGPSIYSNITRNIRSACASYDHLPAGVRAAVAASTGFPTGGCN